MGSKVITCRSPVKLASCKMCSFLSQKDASTHAGAGSPPAWNPHLGSSHQGCLMATGYNPNESLVLANTANHNMLDNLLPISSQVQSTCR